ncbi:MAG TPA: carbohydrate-binding protein, partial [Chthoniobacteraceae bacterium]|nr:carbohydrate-binding protein [Chthoniobacteraceae bacterium]
MQRSASEVLLVYNSTSPVSTAIAGYYEQRRGVTNVLAVQCPDSALSALNENIPFTLYNVEIATPVREYLSRHRGINFIVLTKGVPIRIAGTYLGNIGGDSYSNYNNINVTGARILKARIANPGGIGTIQICLDSQAGTVIGTCPAPHTGSYEKWATASCHIAATTGTHSLYFNYSGGFNLEWFSLNNNPAMEVQAAAYDGASDGLQAYPSSEGGAATGSEPIGTAPENLTPSVDSYLAALGYPSLPGVKKAKITGSGATGFAWINRYYQAKVPF